MASVLWRAVSALHNSYLAPSPGMAVPGLVLIDLVAGRVGTAHQAPARCFPVAVRVLLAGSAHPTYLATASSDSLTTRLAATAELAITYRPDFVFLSGTVSFAHSAVGSRAMFRPPVALALLWVVLIAGRSATARADEADDQYAVAAGHYAAQRWALAVDEFQALLKEHPDYGPNHKSRFFLAEALVQLGRYDEAQSQFREYLRQEPSGAYATQAGFRAGEAALLGGHPSAAREALQDFAAKHPTDKLNAYVLNYLGQIAVSDGSGAEAEHEYREAIERFPQDALQDDYHYGLARAELEGKRPEAEKLYRKLADGADKALAEQAMLRLATSQSAGGRYADAAETFEAFEAQYPASKQLTQARTEHARAISTWKIRRSGSDSRADWRTIPKRRRADICWRWPSRGPGITMRRSSNSRR